MKKLRIIIVTIFLFVLIYGMTKTFTSTELCNCNNVPEWTASNAYEPESQVIEDDVLYENKWYTENQSPKLNSGEYDVWKVVGACDPDATPTPTSETASPTEEATEEPTETPDPNRTQAPYPEVDAASCGSWVLIDNVCSARYCDDDLSSEDCSKCGGNSSSKCKTVSSKGAVSGAWTQVTSISDNESWRYSRSTHYGIGKGGACAFGLYNICAASMDSSDSFYNTECEDFCKAYPDLCADQENVSLRGNWVAPQGNYYTQFWPSLPGERDNYLSCGECFEIVRTKKDGTDYEPGEEGYTGSVVATVADSCPCSANSKWCCGTGRDHCNEVKDFKYGCPGTTAPEDRDPLPDESMHIDLSSITMARLQTGDASGGIVDGVIPIKYRRVPCPITGNIHIWLLNGAGTYYFSFSVVNVANLGSVTKVQAQMKSGKWATLQRDPNYTTSRPQERYGTWVTPPGSGPFTLPVSLRFTDATGKTLEAPSAIKQWKPDDSKMEDRYFIDTGVQF